MKTTTIVNPTGQTNSEFIHIDNGVCHPDSEKISCDGWSDVSLSDCQTLCDRNKYPVNDSCIPSEALNCHFIMFEQKQDSELGSCRMYNKCDIDSAQDNPDMGDQQLFKIKRKCFPNFIDTGLDSCQKYAEFRYCTVTGDFGPGWEFHWGTFENYKVDDPPKTAWK
jgi:hypothetical protein